MGQGSVQPRGRVREEGEDLGDPVVTIVIAVYRARLHLRGALQSILDQTYRNLEILVVDDGNTDDSMASIAGIDDDRVTILQQAHAGKAAALNRALAVAEGEFYAIQDADDISDPRRIERQLAVMRARPEIACTFCGFDLILEGRRVAPLFPDRSIEECRQKIDDFRMPGHDPTTMFRMSMVKHLRFEESLAIGQGFDYVLRVGEQLPMLTIGECLYSYRVDNSSHSRRDPVRRDEFVRAILSRACIRRGVPQSAWPQALRRRPVTQDSQSDPDNNLAAHFMESALHLRRLGRYGEGLRTAWMCARMRPLDLHYLKALVYMLVPAALLRFIRRSAHHRAARTASSQA